MTHTSTLHRRMQTACLCALPFLTALAASSEVHAADAAAVSTETTTSLTQSASTGATANAADSKATAPAAPVTPQTWNLHVQNTDIVQGYPAFPAKYSGANSLPAGGETRETVSLDLTLGVRLWQGAELHLDGILWQGYGIGNALGAAGFPNGEAFRLGTAVPNENLCRVFVRQTFGFGGEQEAVADDSLHLAGMQDVSRLTITLGRMSAKDIFDNNAYANDARSQFMNWSLLANGAWDFPADALGYITGLTVELNQPQWTWRFGAFQVPRVSNGVALDWHLGKAYSLVSEFERRFTLGGHPGVVRLLGFLEHADMGSFAEAIDAPVRPADIAATRQYRSKYGFGLNIEQEIAKNVGVFCRLGWNNGQAEPWAFTDVDRTASLGLSVKGEVWKRPDDVFGLAFVLNGITHAHQVFLNEGGRGILVGDGALSYGPEKILETYYDVQIVKDVHFAVDFQCIGDPAYNRDRGFVVVFGGRLHWEF